MSIRHMRFDVTQAYRLMRDNSGASAIEYALIISLLAVIILFNAGPTGQTTNETMNNVSAALEDSGSGDGDENANNGGGDIGKKKKKKMKKNK